MTTTNGFFKFFRDFQSALSDAYDRAINGSPKVDYDQDSYDPLRDTALALLQTEGYSFGVPEEVDRVIKPQESWVVINHYGAECLLTKEIIILDVDIALLKGANEIEELNNSKAVELRREDKDRIVGIIDKLTVPWRLYETAAGHRLMLQVSPWSILREGDGADYDRLVADLGVDPKFLAMCKLQQNWRARLTTKPWRTDGESLNARDLEHGIEGQVAIARLVASSQQYDATVGAAVIAEHDAVTGASLPFIDELPLA